MSTAVCEPRKHTPYILSGYLEGGFSPDTLQRAINNTIKRLTPFIGEFDSIAFRGVSGALVAPAVAAALGKHLVVVRKGEECHSGYHVEGNIFTESYVIVDDIIASGQTVKNIIESIERQQYAAWQSLRDYPSCDIKLTEQAPWAKCCLVALWKQDYSVSTDETVSTYMYTRRIIGANGEFCVNILPTNPLLEEVPF